MERFHFNYNNERNDRRSCCARAYQPQSYHFTFFCQIQIHIRGRWLGGDALFPWFHFLLYDAGSSYSMRLREVNHDHLYWSLIYIVPEILVWDFKFHLSLMVIHWHCRFYFYIIGPVSQLFCLALLMRCSLKFFFCDIFLFSSSPWKIYWWKMGFILVDDAFF